MTTRQKEILEFIRTKQRVVTVGPTLREVAEHIGVYGNAVQRHVAALREAGELDPERGCGLVVVSPAKAGSVKSAVNLDRSHKEIDAGMKDRKRLDALVPPDGFVVGKLAVERLKAADSLAEARADRTPILRPREKKARK